MKTTIFYIASLLSSFGMLGNLNMSIHQIDKGRGPLLLLTSIIAWYAYFKMGNAWIRGERLGVRWPTIGTLFAVLSLNGGGVWFFLKYNIWMVAAINVFPAILMALWLVQYHIKSEPNNNA